MSTIYHLDVDFVLRPLLLRDRDCIEKSRKRPGESDSAGSKKARLDRRNRNDRDRRRNETEEEKKARKAEKAALCCLGFFSSFNGVGNGKFCTLFITIETSQKHYYSVSEEISTFGFAVSKPYKCMRV